MNKQQWIDYLTVLLRVPDYIDDETKRVYSQFDERLHRIVETNLDEADSITLLQKLKLDITRWNEEGDVL